MARGRAGRWYSLVVLLSAIALGSKAARSQPLPNPPQLQADGDEMLCAIALNTLAELEARLETTPLETLSNQEIANLNQSVDTLGNTINRHCPPDRANTRDPQDAVSADGPSNRPARPEPLETHDPEIQDATPAETISDTPPAPSKSPWNPWKALLNLPKSRNTPTTVHPAATPNCLTPTRFILPPLPEIVKKTMRKKTG